MNGNSFSAQAQQMPSPVSLLAKGLRWIGGVIAVLLLVIPSVLFFTAWEMIDWLFDTGAAHAARRIISHWLLRIWLVTSVAIWLTFNYSWAYDLSSFAFALGKVSLLLTIGWVIDTKHFDAINTVELFKQQPISYAIVLSTLLAALAYIVVNS